MAINTFGKEGMGMKRTLGKKNCVQDGTLVAFASCSCDSMCSILGCDCSTGDTASNTLRLQNYSKLLSKAISGTWAY